MHTRKTDALASQIRFILAEDNMATAKNLPRGAFDEGLDNPANDLQGQRFCLLAERECPCVESEISAARHVEAGAKSYLIDTIVRGLPIPVILLRDLKTDLQTFKVKRRG